MATAALCEPSLALIDTSKYSERFVALMKTGEKNTLEAGKFVFQKGQDAHHIYVILSGEVDVRTHENGDQSVLETMTPGSIFGEGAILQQREKRSRSLFVKETCEVIKIERAQFEAALCEINPNLPNEAAGRSHELRILAYIELVAPSIKMEFKKGEFLYRQGDRQMPCLYIVKSGVFDMIRKEKAQREIVVDSVHKYECFGVERLLDPDPFSKKTVSLRCASPTTELLVVNGIDFHRLCDHSIVVLPYVKTLVHQRRQHMLSEQAAQGAKRVRAF